MLTTRPPKPSAALLYVKVKLSRNKSFRLRERDGMLVLYPYFEMAAQLGRQSCHLSAPATLYPKEIPWYSLLLEAE